MQKLRVHISKMFIISCIWFGFGLYLAQPVQADSSARSFANWLSYVAQQDNSSEFTQELNRMRDTGVGLSELIQYASQVISEHDDGFNLPLNGASGSHQIYQLLLSQWNQFQTGSGMANVPPPEAVKSSLALQVDKFSAFGGGVLKNDINEFYRGYEIGIGASCFDTVRPVIPMVTGIAIGAP